MIKAIPTRYRGYHFRSRLEARWAVFFDALGIEWEYEPEGFELPDGTRYLPDFWLPTIEGGTWVEVKGDSRDWDVCIEAERKLQGLSRASGKVTQLLFGIPKNLSDPCGFAFAPTDKNELGYWCIPTVLPFSNAAIAAARSARFEHGQSGATA